jgi:hypothetical protein
MVQGASSLGDGNLVRRSKNCRPGYSRSSKNWMHLKAISHHQRWPSDWLSKLDAIEAMRRLIEQALPGFPHRGRQSSETAHKASELAANAIERLTDKSRPRTERARAK